MLNWQLSLAYFIHLIATVVWIGGVVISALVVWPSHSHLTERDARIQFAQWQRRFSPLALLAMIALTGSGLMQMAADPNYEGLLQIFNLWSWVMLFKHLAFVAMVLVSVYSAYGLYPALSRQLLLFQANKPAPNLARLQGQMVALNWVNLGAAVLVLAFTAIAGAI